MTSTSNIIFVLVILFVITKTLNKFNNSSQTKNTEEICAFWNGDRQGLEQNTKLCELKLNHTLHGWFPKRNGTSVDVLVPIEEFKALIIIFGYLNKTNTLAQFTNDEDWYKALHKKYKKHGHGTKHTVLYWLSRMRDCLNLNDNQTQRYPRICRYNKTEEINYVQEYFLNPTETTGCKERKPYSYNGCRGNN